MYQSRRTVRALRSVVSIVDLAANHAIYQVPVELWTDSGLPMTYNRSGSSRRPTGCGRFRAGGRESTLYVFEAEVK
jgi:hypothetical protein